MKQPPFKVKGIYARKIDPKKEFENYKPTKLGSMMKVALGKKEENFYEILWFAGIYDSNDIGPFIVSYFAGYSNIGGEILDLADWQKNRGSAFANYNDVKFDERRFEFGDETILFSGSFVDDILYLNIINKVTRDSCAEKLRYIPWI